MTIPEKGCGIIPDWDITNCCQTCHQEGKLRKAETLTICCNADFWLSRGNVKSLHTWEYSPTEKHKGDKARMIEPLWLITMLSLSPGNIKAPKSLSIRAVSCDEQNGALVFRGGAHSSIKAIVAAGVWLQVERVEREVESK